MTFKLVQPSQRGKKKALGDRTLGKIGIPEAKTHKNREGKSCLWKHQTGNVGKSSQGKGKVKEKEERSKPCEKLRVSEKKLEMSGSKKTGDQAKITEHLFWSRREGKLRRVQKQEKNHEKFGSSRMPFLLIRS